MPTVPAHALTPQAVLDALHWRYAAKVFDPTKTLTPEQWTTLEQVLVWAPSSFGLQPWQFIHVTDRALKRELRAVSWNQAQVEEAPHLMVFAAHARITARAAEEWIRHVSAVRGVPAEKLAEYQQIMTRFIEQKLTGAAGFQWAARQCYIALGNLLTAAALLGIDTCPLEGIDAEAYDRILQLEHTDYRTVVACALGHRAAGDHYARLKKVRYPVERVMVRK